MIKKKRTGNLHAANLVCNIELISNYPRTARHCIVRCSCSLITSILIGGIYLLLLLQPLSQSQPMYNIIALKTFMGIGFCICFTVFVVCFLYEILSHVRYVYRIDRGNLIIERGLIIRETGSFPLSGIAAIYLDQSFLEMLFGLRRLHITTPAAESGSFAWIDGLSATTAHGLKKELESLSQAYRVVEARGAFPHSQDEDENEEGSLRYGRTFNLVERKIASVG